MDKVALRKIALAAIAAIASQSALAAASLPSNYFYMDLSAGGYYLNNPWFKTYGSASNGVLEHINNNGWTPMPEIGLGFAFNNGMHNWFSAIFGQKNRVEIKGMLLQSKQTKRGNNMGSINVYYIDSGQVAFSSNTSGDSYRLQLKQKLVDSSLRYMGMKSFWANRVNFLPYVGVSYFDNEDEVHYRLNFTPGTNSMTDNEDYNITDRFIGPMIGFQMRFPFGQFIPFLGVEGSVLNQQTHMTGYQMIKLDSSSTPFANRSVKEKKTQWSYRTKAFAGLTYEFSELRNIALTLSGGLDRWSDKTKVITRNSSTAPATYIGHAAYNNYYAELTLHVPFG